VRSSVLQCVAVCCSVLQCVAVCCSVLQCVKSGVDTRTPASTKCVLQCVAVCCSASVCCTVSQRVAVRAQGVCCCVLQSTLQHVVLQSVAVLQRMLEGLVRRLFAQFFVQHTAKHT